jgi:polyisoprenoid-binding protein YceI
VERGRDRDTLRITGTVSIKGMSAAVVLDVVEADKSRSPQGLEVAYYSATAEFDRADLGLSRWNGMIGRKVRVTIHAQFSREA